MSNSLSDRIKERLEATGLNNAQLAAAAGVKQPTSFNWGSGKTKNIKGEPLLLAARALGVTPEWLSTGKGQKLRDTSFDPKEVTPQLVSEATQQDRANEEQKNLRARELIGKLPKAALDEAIQHMEWLLEKHKTPYRYPQAKD